MRSFALFYLNQTPGLCLALACITSITIQCYHPWFVLIMPIVGAIIHLYTQKHEYQLRLLSVLAIAFAAAFSYEYQIQQHQYALDIMSSATKVHLTIVDKETVENNRHYKEYLVGSINHPLIAGKNVHLYSTRISHYLPGDEIIIDNVEIKLPKQSDFALFLRKERTIATLFLSKQQSITLVNRPQYSLRRFLWQKRNAVMHTIKEHCSKKTFALASCLFWGNKHLIKQHTPIKESFRDLGITHYLARSGLHMAIFVLLWLCMGNILFFDYRKKIIVLLCIGSVYAILSWPTISFMRSFFMFACISIAHICRQRTSSIHVLTLLCALFLITNPAQLFFLDFQLTFGLTWALIWHAQIDAQLNHIININR